MTQNTIRNCFKKFGFTVDKVVIEQPNISSDIYIQQHWVILTELLWRSNNFWGF